MADGNSFLRRYFQNIHHGLAGADAAGSAAGCAAAVPRPVT
jgi:hypothetical protein